MSPSVGCRTSLPPVLSSPPVRRRWINSGAESRRTSTGGSLIGSPTTRRRQTLTPIHAVELDESPVFSAPDAPLLQLKLDLLSAIAGLNRGFAASEDDQKRVDEVAKALEAAGGAVDLFNEAVLNKLQGRWKLVYSSGFNSQTLGGSRPGPPVGRLLPFTPGQVFQRIDVLSKDFDNIAELQFNTPWPLPRAGVTLTLAHKFEVIGTSTIKITFQKTTAKATGSLSQLPPLDIPRIPDALRPQSNTGTGEFAVTYVDADTRITRGDRGELRVFVIS